MSKPVLIRKESFPGHHLRWRREDGEHVVEARPWHVRVYGTLYRGSRQRAAEIYEEQHRQLSVWAATDMLEVPLQ